MKMFHQVFICDPVDGPNPQQCNTSEDVENALNEDMQQQPNNVEGTCKEEASSFKMQLEEVDLEKPVTRNLVKLVKSEDKSESKLLEDPCVKSALHDDVKVVKEEKYEEEGRPGSVKLEDQEKLEIKDEKDCLVLSLKPDQTQRSLPSNKDATFSDSKLIDGGCKRKIPETLTPNSNKPFQIIIFDNADEYITPDEINLTPESSLKSATSAKLNLDNKKLVSSIKKISDSNNEQVSSEGCKFVVDLPTSVTELIKEHVPKGDKSYLSEVSKETRLSLNARPKRKASVVKSKQNISDKSSSPVFDWSDSGSDWEQDYLVSKSAELKKKPVTKKLCRTRLAEKRRGNVTSLKSSDQAADKSNAYSNKSVANLTKQSNLQSTGQIQTFLVILPGNSVSQSASEDQLSAGNVFSTVTKKPSSNSMLPKEADTVLLESNIPNNEISSQKISPVHDDGSVDQSIQDKFIGNKKPKDVGISMNVDKAAEENNYVKILPKGDRQTETIYEQILLNEPKMQNKLDESSFKFSIPAAQCKKCNRMYNSKEKLLTHLKQSLCGGKRRKKKHQCDTCGSMFRRLQSLVEHLNSHNNVKPFKCSACNKSFENKHSQISHYKSRHLKIKKNLFLCCYCPMTSSSLSHLLAHEESHRLSEGANVELPFECDKCKRRYLSKFKLVAHLKEHYPFKCKVCKRKYPCAELLEKHVKSVHQNPREFKCDVCDKVFYRSESLRIHKKNVHQSYNRFYCDICDKGFKQKHHIEQHMITHSDERPISCAHCDETFKRKTHLKQHITAFHGEGRKS